MKITELLEEAGVKVTCGCTEDTCSHCAGKHTLEEVGKKCSCCGNEIKEVKINEMSAGAVAAVAMPIGNVQSRNNTATTSKKKKKTTNTNT